MQELIFALSKIIDSDYYPLLVVLSFFALAFSKNRKAFIIALLIVTILTPTLKSFYQEERPNYQTYGQFCKAGGYANEFGLPSGHAATSILLAGATLGSFAFFLFLPLASLIAFSRVALGCHTINQVIAGMSLGLLIFFIFQRFYSNRNRIKQTLKTIPAIENGRQFIHIFTGYFFILLLYWMADFGKITTYAKESVEMILFALLVWGFILINMKMLGMRIGPLDYLLSRFDRKNEFFQGRGPLLYLVGVMLIFSFSRSNEFIPGAIAIFATGDGISTLVGMKYGSHRLSWNKRKSWEGTAAFFASASLASYIFLGPIGIFYSGVLALVETLDFEIDDNLLIPLFAVAMNVFL